MLTRTRKSWEIPESKATPEAVFDRRRVLAAGLAAGPILLGGSRLLGGVALAADAPGLAPELYPAKHDDAYKLDRPLTPEHGAPLRLYAPIKLGYKMTKYLTTVSFTSERPGGYWEDQGYPWFGGI